jgi:pyridoxine 5-phosphate synthase
MTKLSVNINKIATLRNARGGNNPNLVQVAKDIERFGAQGITIHPRPDQRHIRYADAFDLAKIVKTEYNIEGNPKKGDFLKIVKELKPTQATLVPDSDNVLTSNAGWDTIQEEKYLSEVVAELNSLGIRTSIFVDPVEKYIEGAAKVGTDRIELYTESYAQLYSKDAQKAIEPYQKSAILANKLGLGINAGHDLDLNNLKFFAQNIPQLLEVSIGHAIVCDALYYGLENTVQLYLRELDI